MLSILIPTYKYDCRPLVERMRLCAERLGRPYEILVADDASPETYRTQNREIDRWPNCRYVQSGVNLGPARIRNLLVSEARYPCLLFLDADVMPQTDDFLVRYWTAAQMLAGESISAGRPVAKPADGMLPEVPPFVICGGFVYPPHPSSPRAVLRHKYGVRVEAVSAVRRARAPYRAFISMNFFTTRACLARVPFDAGFHQYGYEDALFGMQLAAAGIPVRHIDNPVCHLVEEDSAAYLKKIRRAVRNAAAQEARLGEGVRLLRWYGHLHRWGLGAPTAILFRLTEKAVERQLCGRHPSLKLFAFYKLGYLCRLKRNPSEAESEQ